MERALDDSSNKASHSEKNSDSTAKLKDRNAQKTGQGTQICH